MGAFGAIAGALGWVGKVVTYVPTVVQIIETLSDLFESGSDKKAAAIKLVRQAILTSEEFSGKEIVDEEAFTNYIGQIVDGVVGAMNATVWKK